ncbi:MAG: PDZ domain-containing protein [Candidatus Melainabacteria bacterium]|nr:MAG: PDZ domain-containing protein [Candidatus Melainabacteria bacterium]
MKRLLGCFVLLFSLFLATDFHSSPVQAQTQVQPQAIQRFDGKLLYKDAFEHVRDNHLALLTTSAREKWIKTWENRYSDKWLRKSGNADLAIVRMLESLKHKHDNYFTRSQWQTQVDESHGFLVGIGAIFEVINKTTNGGMTNRYTLSVERQLVVAEDPANGSPAAKAGLQKGDIVLFVQGHSVRGQVAQDVIDTINGSIKGTKVRLTIKRQDSVKQIRLTRDLIITPTVKFLEVNSNTAYIKQLDFSSELVESEMRAALTKASKYKTLILDLRGNLGGRLEAALSVFAQTHESGTAVVMRERMFDKLVETTFKFTPTEFHTITSENGVVTETNIVARADEFLLALNSSTKVYLLIDDESASASEIVAGAYKVSNRGVVIGIKSYGKDVGQSVFEIQFGRGISVTSFEFFPGGVSMNRQGIDPHIVVNQRGNGDKQFERALEEAIKP